MRTEDRITPDEVENLSRLFLERVARNPDKTAYQYFDGTLEQWCDISWQTMADRVAQWQGSLNQENLVPGDRVGIMMKNSPEWVICEQATLGLGLVVVPLYLNDRTDNTCHIINDAEIKVIFIDGLLQCKSLQIDHDSIPSVTKIVSLQDITEPTQPLLHPLKDWLVETTTAAPARLELERHSLASIVYTSGTTGKPKGVMLSHGNILSNAYASSLCYPFQTTDTYLSFLPLSHMFERTVGYYLPMITGGTVAYARSIDQLAEDFVSRKPTILVTVPRIFERVYNKLNAQLKDKPPIARSLFGLTITTGWKRFLYAQKKAAWSPLLLLWPLLYWLVARKVMHKLGGRMRVAISGGAALSFEVGRLFTALGLTISQGYGMTESGPVVCTNRVDDNDIASVGQALPDVEARIGDDDELLVRSPGVMLGYWKNQSASEAVLDMDGWLHTGDKARIDGEHIYITGRLKEIIVLSNGEKIPPGDIELAITTDTLFEQALLVGEAKPFLTVLVTLNKKQFELLSRHSGFPVDASPNTGEAAELILQHIKQSLAAFPGYAKIYRAYADTELWTVEDGYVTPTLKLKRNILLDKYAAIIDDFYRGH